MVLERWRRHRLPSIPELVFAAAPVAVRSSTGECEVRGVHHLGDVEVAREIGPVDVRRARLLEVSIDADGITLDGPMLDVGDGEAAAIVPLMSGQPIDEAALAALAPHGLTVVRPSRPGPVRLVLALRVQRFTALGLDAEGDEVARGIVHLGDVNDPARRRARRQRAGRGRSER